MWAEFRVPNPTRPILKRGETDEKTFALCLYGTTVSVKLLDGRTMNYGQELGGMDRFSHIKKLFEYDSM